MFDSEEVVSITTSPLTFSYMYAIYLKTLHLTLNTEDTAKRSCKRANRTRDEQMGCTDTNVLHSILYKSYKRYALRYNALLSCLMR